MLREWQRDDGYVVSTDPQRLDLDTIHGFLTRSYWASGRSRAAVAATITCSMCFGLYVQGQQVGFARVVTDQVVIAFLADVFVLEEHRGRGLGKWLVGIITEFPELAGVRRWVLGARDAHGLYRRFGFEEPEPGILMQRLHPSAR